MADVYNHLLQTNNSKIVMVILDGLGGLPRFPGHGHQLAGQKGQAGLVHLGPSEPAASRRHAV